MAPALAWLALGLAPACGGGGDDSSEAVHAGSAGAHSPAGSGGSSIGFGGANGLGGAMEQGGEAGKTCGATAIHADPPKVNVLLVIDKSSSMENHGGFSKSKWDVLKEALATSLLETEQRVAFGLDFYPLASDSGRVPETCETPSHADPVVPVAPGRDAVPRILEKLEEHAPAGGTPTSAALSRALEYFRAGEGAGLEGERYLLLATDGGPNCNPERTCEAKGCTLNMEGLNCGGNCCDAAKDPLGPMSCLDEEGPLQQIQALAKLGVKTFVVGIPGSELYEETLNRLARAGLAPNEGASTDYYRVTADGDAEGLASVLTRLTTGVIKTCILQLATRPPDLGKLNVEVDGQIVPQVGDNGWMLDLSTQPPSIVLKGETCGRMEIEGAESVKIVYGCPTVDVPR